jgi:hypothetical protein
LRRRGGGKPLKRLTPPRSGAPAAGSLRQP